MHLHLALREGSRVEEVGMADDDDGQTSVIGEELCVGVHGCFYQRGIIYFEAGSVPGMQGKVG